MNFAVTVQGGIIWSRNNLLKESFKEKVQLSLQYNIYFNIRVGHYSYVVLIWFLPNSVRE